MISATLTRTDTQTDWRNAAIALLSVRVIQGFIYWGGGSRRFIYGPQKLNPHAAHWMANKFQTAMPGALLGTDHLVDLMLRHFWLLYPGIILFSAIELLAGLALMLGFMTRAAALVTIGLSIVLMLLFGWQGATCIDEWTMAACNLAMGMTLFLAGSGAFSLDNALLQRRHALAQHGTFRWGAGSLPLPLGQRGFAGLGLVALAFVLAFDVGTYNYYRGSVFSAFHEGPVSPSKHHFTMDSAMLLPDGSVRFHINLNGGTPEAPAHIMQADLLDAGGKSIAQWSMPALASLPPAAIVNDYAYNTFKPMAFGIAAGMGAKATITLPPPAGPKAAQAATRLQITDVNAVRFTVPIVSPTHPE